MTTKERSLSTTQIRMLRHIHDGEPYDLGAYGMSERAGAESTLNSLVRRELVTYYNHHPVITAFGRLTLKEIDADS